MTTMSTQAVSYEYGEPKTVAEAEVDSHGRVSLGMVGARPGRRYRVERNIDDVLILIPVVSFPERERIVWDNPGLAREILEGIDEAERGETVDLGDFAGYDEDDDEE